MPKQNKDKLILLINSLSKAEKRSFRLYVNRNSGAAESKFVKLFNHLDKAGHFEESKVLMQITDIKKSQLSNIKANLYKQILTCLRLIERAKIGEIQVREQIDFAKILYEKGLYQSCLELLDKAKKQALEINFETLALSILYFEKRIESQHVTGSMAEKADALTNQSDNLLQEISITNQLSNLSLLLFGRYLRYGYVKNEQDFNDLKTFFQRNLPSDVDPQTLSFFQKLYLYQSYVWYSNMSQDFAACFKYAQKWVDLFDEEELQKTNAATIYIKGLHNLLNALFMSGKRERYNGAYEKYKAFQIDKVPYVTRNEISNYKLFLYTHQLNQMLINGSYGELEVQKEIEKLILDNPYNWDTNRLLALRYKLGCVYFGNNDLGNCILTLNKISNKSFRDFREDIQCFARILNLIAHYDSGNEELVNYKLKSLYRFLSKMKDLEKMQLEIIKFLRRTTHMEASKMENEFKKLRDVLLKIADQPYEKRPFLYLDIISWLEGKMTDKKIGEVIKAKIYG